MMGQDRKLAWHGPAPRAGSGRGGAFGPFLSFRYTKISTAPSAALSRELHVVDPQPLPISPPAGSSGPYDCAANDGVRIVDLTAELSRIPFRQLFDRPSATRPATISLAALWSWWSIFQPPSFDQAKQPRIQPERAEDDIEVQFHQFARTQRQRRSDVQSSQISHIRRADASTMAAHLVAEIL